MSAIAARPTHDEQPVGAIKFFARGLEVILDNARESLSDDDYAEFLQRTLEQLRAEDVA